MPAPSRLRRSLLALSAFLCAGVATAQQQPAPSAYEPSVGQGGKDVMWVPTSQALVDKMLDMAQVSPNDHVIDLGSGDGRLVIFAAKRGATALGIEFNPNLVELSKRSAHKEGVGDRATFVKADIFESDFSKATVVTMFLLPEINLQLRSQLLDLKPGTRIVSNTFTMDEWPADASVTASEAEGCRTYCSAYLWIVPEKVAGTWKLPQGELTFEQEFQMLSGQLRVADKPMPITNGRLRGDRMTFKVDGVDYSGRVNGDRMEGSSNGSLGTWTATRIRPAAVEKK